MSRIWLGWIALFAAGACRAPLDPEVERAASAAFDGGAVHFVERGASDARALVFVHGWGCSTEAWTKQMDGFREYRRIALDLPGHGRSTWREMPFSMDYFADAVGAVLDQAQVREAVLVGHSNGAPVIRQFWRRHPERVAGLVIVDGAVKSFFDEPQEAESFLAALGGESGRELFASAFLDPMLAPMRDAGDREAARAMMLATPPWVLLSAGRAAFDPSIWTEDPIRTPTLMLMAPAPFWTDEYKAFAAQVAPGHTWITLEDVSHFLMLDAPAEFEAHVSEFLARCSWREL